MGHKQTQETRNKISSSLREQWKLGKRCPRKKGFKLSNEHKRKIGLANSISLKGHKLSKESIEKRTLASKWYRHSEKTRQLIGKKNSIALKGRIMPVETKLKISNSNKGEKSYLWKGGITPVNLKIRGSLEYRLWRESVFKRDDFTCIWCKQKGGRLNADHIKSFADFPELRFAIDNGRTLCEKCHRTTDNFGRRKTKILIN